MPPRVEPLRSEDAELALERAATDPGFATSLRAAYRGRHDVLDALWWVAHPLTDSARGVADPALELRALQRAVFARPASEPPHVGTTEPETDKSDRIRESEQRFQEARRLLTEDARHLAEALSAVSPTTSVLTPAPRAASSTPKAPVKHDRSEPRATLPRSTPPLRLKTVIPLLAGAGLVLAILVLPSVSGLTGGVDGAPISTPTLTPTYTTPPRVTTEIVTFSSDGNIGDPLAVLERPATDADEPRFSVEYGHEPGSFRILPDMIGHLKLYLARGEEEASICLVAVRSDSTALSSCVSETTFVDGGIRLSGSGRYPIGSDVTILTEAFSLLANGDLHYDATARARVESPGAGNTAPPS